MKKILLAFFLTSYLVHAAAQTEVKISPLPLLFGGIAASLEFGTSRDFGIDADLYFIDGSGGGNVSAKYYLTPNYGLDQFHIGGFVGAREEAVGVGFLIGYKWISRKNILFEIGAGLGRSFTEDDYLLGYGKLHMGYRFGKKVSGPTKPQSQNY